MSTISNALESAATTTASPIPEEDAPFAPNRIIDALPGLIWTARPDGQVDFLNQRWCEYTGLSAEEARGQGWQTAIHPEDLPALGGLWQAILASGKPGEMDARMRRFDGEYRWFLFRASPITDASGQVVQWCGINTDIDDRRRADEAELKLSDESFRAIFETTPECVKILAPNGRLMLVNPAGLVMAGAETASMVLGGNFYDWVAPEYAGQFRAFNDRICSGQKGSLEFEIINMRGERRMVETYAVPLRNNDGAIRHLGVTRDVTERKRSEEKLRRGAAYLAEAQKLSLTGSFGWNASTGELFWSDETFRILGCDPATKPSMEAVFSRVHPDDVALVKQTLDHAARERTNLDFEHRLQLPDGTVKHVRVVARAAGGSDDNEFVGALMDVTAQHQSRIALENAFSEIKRSELHARQIVETMPAIVAVMGPDGELEHCNRQMVEYFGLPLEELKNWTNNGMVHPDDMPRRAAAYAESINTGCPYNIVYRLRRSDGVYRWFQVQGLPLRDVNGRILNWFIVIVDVDESKKTEEKLRRSELHSRLIVDTIPAIVAIMGPDGRLEKSNRQMVEYFGQTLEELTNWGTNGTVHPDDMPRIGPLFAESINTGRSYDAEYRLRRSDGIYRWFQVRGLPLRDADDRIVNWYIVVVDIEENKKAEEKLARSELRSRLIVDTIPAIVAVLGPDGTLEQFNRQMMEYFDQTVEELRNWGSNGTVHPDDLPRITVKMTEAITTGCPYDVEYRLRRSDGIYRWFQVRGLPLRDADNRIVNWYFVITDIEESKIAAQKLHQSEIAARMIVDCIPALVTVVRPDGELERVNRRVLEYCGQELEVLKHWASNGTIHPDEMPQLAVKYSDSMTTGCPFESDNHLRRFDGVYRWFKIRGLPLRDAEGLIVNWYFLLIDIEESKKIEEALTKVRSELAHVARVTSLGALAASIAHEVNQPLAAVVTNADACLRFLNHATPDLDEARQAIRSIIRDGHRGSEVIGRIRTLLKKEQLSRTQVDVNETVEETVKLAQYELQGTVLQMELANQLPCVLADRVQLQQVLLNLVMNAIDAMKSAPDRPSVLRIVTKPHENDTVLVSVQDTGIGIQPEKMDQLFETFYTTKPAGLGMGLSISHSIIESHGGRLWAESNAGPGAAFLFTLPAETESVI